MNQILPKFDILKSYVALLGVEIPHRPHSEVQNENHPIVTLDSETETLPIETRLNPLPPSRDP